MAIKDLFDKEKDIEPRVLIESNSPNCNIQAFAEEDDRCVYFYLCGESEYEGKFMNSCWVRNYEKAPKDMDIQTMRDGRPPMLQADCCSHPSGAKKLDSERLEIVWFEEGDGAALLYDEDILCVIPGWSNSQCPGYAKDCINESPLAWPLGNPSDNVLFVRVRRAKEFWDSWDDNSWGKIQESYIEAIEKSIGKYDKYYAIDGGYWPPKAMVTIEKGELTYIITLGVSIIPQPKVEMCYEEPKDYRRFEFGFIIKTELLNKNKNGILSYISGQTALPWSCLTWLGDGHTIPCDQIWPENEEFSFMLLQNGNKNVPFIDFPLQKGDPINVLWMIPISCEQRKYAEDNGSEKLINTSKHKDNLWIFDGENKFDI